MARKPASQSKTTVKRYSAVPPTTAVAPKEAAAVKPTATPGVAAAAMTAAVCAGTKDAVTSTAKSEAKSVSVAVAEPAKSAHGCCSSQAIADPAIVAELISSLHSSDADIARESAVELGTLRASAAVIPLIQVIDNVDGYHHVVVRAAAAASLGQLHDARAVEPLLRLVADPIAEASAEAIRALAHLGDARAIEPLIGVVRNNTGYFLAPARRAAVLALARLGGPAATAELQSVASNPDEDPVIRAEAGNARQSA